MAMSTVIRNCHLIDGISARPMFNATVVITAGRIAEVITNGRASRIDDARVIDAKEGWVLPGLGDSHVHLRPRTGLPYVAAGGPLDMSYETIMYGLKASEGLTQAGVTLLRTASGERYIDLAWKRAFDAGHYLGPRMFVCGRAINTTGGHTGPRNLARSQERPDGPWGIVREIREQISHGVDHIKLVITGGLVGPFWDNHRNVDWLDEEIEAAFAICRQRKVKVMVHAANPAAIKKAIALGAWSIEHGYSLDDEAIQMMADKGTFYVPTLCISQLTPRQVTNRWEQEAVQAQNLSEDLVERADRATEEHKMGFQAALKAGVKMANGSDSYITRIHVDTPLEISLWTKCGATPMQAIAAATKGCAEIVGADDELGTVEAGKLADLILLKDSPLEDINSIRTIEMVMKGGDIVVDKRGEED